MKKICVVTATRAEYGLLKNLLYTIEADNDLELVLVVTGTHLSKSFGYTVKEIKNDGFKISRKIDILLDSDSPAGIAKTMGIASMSFADFFADNHPDILVVLGDRYELLPICSTAMSFNIPIAHISGGETTEGAIDEAIRHCITKLSYLHFPTCDTYRNRIIQLGENPEKVFNFGSLGVENIHRLKAIPFDELNSLMNNFLSCPYIVVTFHPETLSEGNVTDQLNELLSAISNFPDMKFVFTKSNADAGGKTINLMIEEYVGTHNNSILVDSLGSTKYLSLLSYSAGVLGNSSSGILEAPSFKIPTINIGDRQKGRIAAKSVISCPLNSAAITDSLRFVLSQDFRKELLDVVNPYEGKDTAFKIVKTIKSILQKDNIDLKKAFFDLPIIYGE